MWAIAWSTIHTAFRRPSSGLRFLSRTSLVHSGQPRFPSPVDRELLRILRCRSANQRFRRNAVFASRTRRAMARANRLPSVHLRPTYSFQRLTLESDPTSGLDEYAIPRVQLHSPPRFLGAAPSLLSALPEWSQQSRLAGSTALAFCPRSFPIPAHIDRRLREEEF